MGSIIFIADKNKYKKEVLKDEKDIGLDCCMDLD